MKDDFYKFPSTPHLALLGDIEVRDDKIMPEAERDKFLQNKIVVEEKIDGANLGISFDVEGNIRTQNGDHICSYRPQVNGTNCLIGSIQKNRGVF